MKNLKIIGILFLVVAVSYFLFMVTGKKEANAPTTNDGGTVLSELSMQSESSSVETPSVEKSYATWTVDGQVYKSLGVQTVQYSSKSSNYPQDGEMLLIFGDYDSGTMSLIFPGKRAERFVGMKAREPYFEPMLHYSFYKDNQLLSYTTIVDITGDPVEINITRFDDQFIEGTFSGILTNLDTDGYHYDKKINVTDGQFKVDLQTYQLKEI